MNTTAVLRSRLYAYCGKKVCTDWQCRFLMNTCTTICHIKLLWNVLKSDVQSKSSQTVRLIPGFFFVYYLFHLFLFHLLLFCLLTNYFFSQTVIHHMTQLLNVTKIILLNFCNGLYKNDIVHFTIILNKAMLAMLRINVA